MDHHEDRSPLTFADAKKLRDEVLHPKPKTNPTTMGNVYAFLRKKIRDKKIEAFLFTEDVDLNEAEIEELRLNGWVVEPKVVYIHDRFGLHTGWTVELPGSTFTFEEAVKVHYDEPLKRQYRPDSHMMKRVYERLRYEVDGNDKDSYTFSLSEIDENGAKELSENGWRVTKIYDSVRDYTSGWRVDLPRATRGHSQPR